LPKIISPFEKGGLRGIFQIKAFINPYGQGLSLPVKKPTFALLPIDSGLLKTK